MDFMPIIIGGEDEIDIEPEIIDQPKLEEDDIERIEDETIIPFA